jgi:LAO/AO transport system kinase
MEIPDLLVVNKADHGATATRAASDLKAALNALRQVGAGEGEQAVILTSARDRQGIDRLALALAEHRALLGEHGIAARRKAGHVAWSVEWLMRRVGTLGLDALGGLEPVTSLLEAAVGRGEPALSAAQQLADQLSVARR